MFLHIKEEKVTCQRKGERYSLGCTYGIHFVTLTRPYGVETGALILGLKHICFQKKKKCSLETQKSFTNLPGPTHGHTSMFGHFQPSLGNKVYQQYYHIGQITVTFNKKVPEANVYINNCQNQESSNCRSRLTIILVKP